MLVRDLLDRAVVQARFEAAGYEEATARRAAEHMVRAAEGLENMAATAEANAFFVPGRIEVLGKHTDYAGGSSLTCATTRGFCIVCAADASDTLRIVRAATGDSLRIDPGAIPEPSAGCWTTYPITVLRRVIRNFGKDARPFALQGGIISFSSNLPQAAGMSSSSAMVVAFFLALRAMNKLADQPLYRSNLQQRTALAAYLAAVENGRPFGPFQQGDGVGTEGGSEDHTAILCAAPRALRRFRYEPVQQEETIPWPKDMRFVIGVSGVVARKMADAKGSYNRAARLAAEAARVWRAETGRDDPHLGAIMRADDALERFRAVLRSADGDTEALIRRGEHFHLENHSVLPAATEAFRHRDWVRLGALVDRSQRAAENLLGNQVTETKALARLARRLGARAASSFGAGYGGAVWALVPWSDADPFLEAWRSAYASECPEQADAARFLIEQPGPPAWAL